MSHMTGVPEDELDYDTIVAAVMETARGRWFLREHERHVRASDTQTLLGAMRRLEAALAPALGAREVPDRQFDALAFDFLPISAEAVASDVHDSAATLQSTSISLRSAEGVEAETAALELQAAKLLTVAYQQEVLSQRVATPGGALSQMDQRLKGHVPKAKLPVADSAGTLRPDHLKYFKPDEDIFAQPSFAPPATSAPDAAPMNAPGTRVVIIRNATGDIPLLGEDASVASV